MQRHPAADPFHLAEATIEELHSRNPRRANDLRRSGAALSRPGARL